MFSIIQRNRHHRSNIYSGAPMPYMQRLTWSGIALHQGKLPGYAGLTWLHPIAGAYADHLWKTIKMNTRVIVSREDVEPFDVTHPLLFQPKPAATTVETVPELRKTFDTTTPERVMMASVTLVATDGAGDGIDGGDTKPAMRDLTPSVDPLSARDAKLEAEAKTDDDRGPAGNDRRRARCNRLDLPAARGYSGADSRELR